MTTLVLITEHSTMIDNAINKIVWWLLPWMLVRVNPVWQNNEVPRNIKTFFFNKIHFVQQLEIWLADLQRNLKKYYQLN